MNLPLRLWPFMLFVPGAFWGGCAAEPVNPSFPVTAHEADRDLARMASDPHPLARPLVIVTGFMDPGVAAVSLQSRFAGITHDDRVIAVSLADCFSFEGCRQKVIRAVERALPSADPNRTQEVDVIGYSLGGIVARYAAIAPADASVKELRIARLFTISSPHRGADDAQRMPLLHPLQKHVRPGSALLAQLDAAPITYRLYPYVRLWDRAIGVENAAPPGQVAWWVPSPALSDPHNGAFADSRILADIARHLRDESPHALTPRAPLPARP